LCIESDVEIGAHWQAIEEAALRASDEGKSKILAEPGQVLFCTSGEFSESDVHYLSRCLPANARLFVACHLRRYDRDPPLMPPPLCWPIESELRWALSEGQLVICSFLDLNQFVAHAEDRGRKIRLAPDTAKFVVETARGEIRLTSSFAEQCGYCYSSIENVVDLMLDFADQTAEAIGDPTKLGAAKRNWGQTTEQGAPIIEAVRDPSEVRDLLERPKDALPSVVQVPVDLLNTFGGLPKRTPLIFSLYGSNPDEQDSTE
jgi:hypothetical protein